MRRKRSLLWWLTVLAVMAAVSVAVPFLILREPSGNPAPRHPQAEQPPPHPESWPPSVYCLEGESEGREVGSVLVGLHTVIRFKSPEGGFSAAQRAELAAARLSPTVKSGRLAQIRAAQTSDGRWGLFVQDSLIATADAQTARLNNTEPRDLAKVWAHNLAEALGVPSEPAEPSRGPLVTTCTRVVDGDTIVIEGGERVRYIGIDTPETKHPRKPVEHLGREASEFNRQLVEGKAIRIEFDVQRRDRYQRLLGYVYVQPNVGEEGQPPAATTTGEGACRTGNGELFVNAELVRQGYAKVYTVPPNVKHTEEFLELQREARENERGLWGTASIAHPTSDVRQPKSD